MEGFPEEHARMVAIETALEVLFEGVCRLRPNPKDTLDALTSAMQQRSEMWSNMAFADEKPEDQMFLCVRIASEIEELKETLSGAVAERLAETS